MLEEMGPQGSWQARIQDFAPRGAKAKRGPRLGGPEARGPKVPPIKNREVCGFGPLLFSSARLID